MLDGQLQDRFSRLLEISIEERKPNFERELRALQNRMASRGQFGSGSNVSQTLEAHQRELEHRAALAWNSLVRAHKILGSVVSDALAQDFKNEINRRISAFAAELDHSLTSHLKRMPTASGVWTLDVTKRRVISKHDIEIDLYVDDLVNSQSQKTPSQYNFYGHVGAVQTGANSSAEVVQNIGAADKDALISALELAREAIRNSEELDPKKQQDLLEISNQCEIELGKTSPNSTILLTMFNVLATSVQAISNAQPAYQAMKVALVPLGIALP